MPSRFSDIIDKHPLKILISVIIAAVATTFSVVTFFHGQHVARLEAQYKRESEDLQKQIRDHEREIASIPSDTPFTPGIPIDSLSRIVDPSKIHTKPGTYDLLNAIPDLYFFATIDPAIWTVRGMSEAAHTAELSGIKPAEIFSEPVLSNIEKASILKWEANADYHLKIRFKESATPLTLKPFIMVQFIPRTDNARYLRLLNSIMSPHIARVQDHGLDSIRQLAAILEGGSGLKGEPTSDKKIAIYRSRDLLSHVLFFILHEAHQPLLFKNKTEILATNIFEAEGVFFLRLKIKEEEILFEDGTEGELWVTREAYILQHPPGYAVIWTYIPSRDRAPDVAVAQQVENWIREFRMSRY